MTKKERFEAVIHYFEKAMPTAETELKFSDPFQLLVAVILSAQCTDKRVNQSTPALFNLFPSAKEMALALPEDVFPLIRSISYPNSKAKYLVGMAKMLVKDFKSVVPSDVEELQKLPGVGRKTANVIASVVHNKAAMAVDTHVFRVSARIGLTTNAKTTFQAEMQLVKFLPEDKIAIAHHWLILHGRYVCTAKKTKCEICGLTAVCRYFRKKQSS